VIIGDSVEVEKAIKAMKRGEMVLIFDGEGREEETDLTIASQFVDYRAIRTMRRDGGGLICTALHHDTAERLGLPYVTEVFKEARGKFPSLEALNPYDIPYDEESSFSITINHRETFTGITDRDRALTITRLVELEEGRGGVRELGQNFRAPGHVVLLRAAENLLESRRGHTELSVALAEMGGLTPMATICEMMGDQGYALPYEDARKYARRNSLVFVEGKEVSRHFLKNFNSFVERSPLPKGRG